VLLARALGLSNSATAGEVGHTPLRPLPRWAENAASGFGGVVVVAYLSALCNLRFTAAQYALITAAASIVGRVLTGTTAGALIERMGYVNFYLLTTVAALPGILLFAWMIRRGLVDDSLSDAGKVEWMNRIPAGDELAQLKDPDGATRGLIMARANGAAQPGPRGR
jgi:PAT family beta-lactamase induction signal transducer AmpG